MKARVLLVAAQFLVALASCGAQDGALRLEFIAAPVRPGAPIYINAMLANPSGERVVVIREHIQFPREKLVFSQARLGISASLSDAALNVQMKDTSGAIVKDREAAQSLDVTISGKKTLEDGPLIEFEFRLVDSKEQSIRIAHTAEALNDQGAEIALAFSDAEVVVSETVAPPPAPAIGCFFFTH
jgi:hypothetical protein